jgi:hypothetical protein
MPDTELEHILAEHAKDIVTDLTFAIKSLGGDYGRAPVEEIYGLSDAYFRAHCQHLLKGNFQPLVDFADLVAKKRAAERFRLHEVIRAGLLFKKVLYPVLVQHPWEDRQGLVQAILAVDKSVDRFVVNLAQIFVHYAKEYLAKDPLEFPVWVEPGQGA